MRIAQDSRHLFKKGLRIPTTFCFSLILILGITVSQPMAQLFGDGSDGSHTVVGLEHLVADMNYTDLTVLAGSFLETHGFTVRVNGNLINGGTITDSYTGGNGANGGNFGSGGGTGSGQNGFSGNPGSAGAGGTGDGGNGGGGGGGGGGAWDSNDGKVASGGRGGSGGTGGRGGGEFTVFARVFINTGSVNANGLKGNNGGGGLTGGKVTYTELIVINRDLAGGGGGGGAGGTGGDGGTVTVVYETLSALGSVTANGGSGGSGAGGGNFRNTDYNAGGSTSEYNGGSGAGFDANGGNGGRGERDSGGGGSGGGGQTGLTGAPGTVNLVQSTLCYVDSDLDGYGDASDPGTDVAGSCTAGFSDNNLDCDDGNAGVNPGASEIVGDGVDQDCDGFDACYADADGDGYGSNSVITGVDLTCTATGESPNNLDCNDGNVGINPGEPETQCNGIDDDCNGATPDEVDNDFDGVSACTDCDDNDASRYPGNPEITCNGIDDDCDAGTLDEIDNDNDGVSACTDCDDNDPGRYPGNVEILDDGIDQDCDTFDASCCLSDRGNANGDGDDKANVADVSYLVSWLFGIPSGPAPVCIKEANANGDGEEKANVSDVSYLVAWLFGIPSGPAPPACP